jgi:cytolysin (calcineurin-like family phosphatase)
MNYDYRVTFVTDYLTITTNVCLELDDTTGNLSDEAYEQASINGMNNIEDEIGKIDETVINDITVTLLLDDEEIELGSFGEFPPVHVDADVLLGLVGQLLDMDGD